MTKEELLKIPFRPIAHMAMAHEHTQTATNDFYGISICNHTKINKRGDFGRSYTHFMYKGKTYKTADAFLKAYNEINQVTEQMTE